MSAVIDALLTPGPRPDYHYYMVAKLKYDWPALWAAILDEAEDDTEAHSRLRNFAMMGSGDYEYY